MSSRASSSSSSCASSSSSEEEEAAAGLEGCRCCRALAGGGGLEAGRRGPRGAGQSPFPRLQLEQPARRRNLSGAKLSRTLARQGSLEPLVRDPRSLRSRPAEPSLLSILLFFHSASGSSVVAIDNKIEQAMDLVKNHLMYAVREEVEILKEQIKQLAEKNSQLERENSLLKNLASPEQLQKFQSCLPLEGQPLTSLPPPSSSSSASSSPAAAEQQQSHAGAGAVAGPAQHRAGSAV